jgi:hypothetical protein
MLRVSTDHVTKNGSALNASRRQKSQKRSEITPVSIKPVRSLDLSEPETSTTLLRVRSLKLSDIFPIGLRRS